MLQELKNENNKTLTENGDLAFKSTLNNLFDMFGSINHMRYSDESEIITSFSKAMNDNLLLSIKALFYFRDIRGGQGERRVFRVLLKHLGDLKPEIINKNIHLISEYGRWDDILELIGTKSERFTINLIHKQLGLDYVSESPSLLAKWLPKPDITNKQKRKLANKICKKIGITQKEYRKMLVEIRKKINLVETDMSNKKWSKIDYSKIPSKAGMKYRQAFYRNDLNRYEEFLESLNKGETKVNSKTLYPHEIVEKILHSFSSDHDKLYNGQWDNLPDYTNGKIEDSLAVVDVSGSMSGLPMNVAIALGMYISERNKGLYHDHFITFSERPTLVQIKGKTLRDRVNSISRADWGYNTDLEAVFNLILKTAINNKLPQDKMVKKLYIFSDMQFDKATKWNMSTFQTVNSRFKECGYELPNVVFWNLNETNLTFPCTINESGFQLVSGYSPTIFKNLMQDKFLSAEEMMLGVLNSERYEKIKI